MARDRTLAAAAMVVGMLLMAGSASAQCAMCRRALQSPEGQQMVIAFRSGILVLLAAPFSLFGIVATLVVRMKRRGSFKRF